MKSNTPTVLTRLALGFTTRRRVGRVSRVGLAKLDPTVFRLYKIFSSLNRLVTDGGSDSNPTKHIEIVKKFLNYSKFSNPT